MDKVLEVYKETASAMLYAQAEAELYTITAENANVQAQAYLPVVKDIYRSPDAEGYDLQNAISKSMAVDSAESVRASIY